MSMSGESHSSRKGFAARTEIRALKRQSDSGQRVAPVFKLTRGEERQLVAAARKGDRRALRRLIDMLSGPVYRFGRGFCGDSPDAEDVAQVVLAAVARRLEDFRGDASLTSWAYVVARNACTRQRRKTIRAGATVQSLDALEATHPAFQLVDPTQDPERSAERSELRDVLGKAIAALPDAQRQVLVLRDVEGLPAAEVARVLNLSERAVKSRLHRARIALRDELSPYAAEAGVRSATQVAGRPARGRAAAAKPKRCPDTVRMISRFIEGELDAQVCARIEKHVLECVHCGEACDTLRGALAGCRSWRREAVPARIKDGVRRAMRDFVATGHKRS